MCVSGCVCVSVCVVCEYGVCVRERKRDRVCVSVCVLNLVNIFLFIFFVYFNSGPPFRQRTVTRIFNTMRRIFEKNLNS